jgi:tetratricopeptide (TPR) repeat protein
MLTRSILVWSALALAAGRTHAQAGATAAPRLYDNLGRHHRAVSTRSPAAQQWFDQGLRLAYAFNHAEAVRAFAEGERLDSSCVMCAWGIAYALGPNINAPMPRDAAREAFWAIGRARARLGGAPPAERSLIEATAARYRADAPADRATLDSAYARAMQALARRFPADDDVQVITGEALMDLAPWVYWTAQGTPRPDTPEILERLERVLGRNPEHPGACHFYIHLVEAVHPDRAVACAERLASLMPGAGHLVHMPAHIYIRVGRFNDAIEINQHAVHADQTYFEGPSVGRLSLYGQGYAPHNWHFMTLAAVMAGRSALALEAARHSSDAIAPEMARVEPLAEAILPAAILTMVSFGRWDAILAEPLPDPALRFASGMTWYARGMAFAATGRFAEAGVAVDSVAQAARAYPSPEMRQALEVGREALRGEIAMRQGNLDEAVRFFRAAVELEDAISYMEPPWWYYPMRHSLGKALLAAGRAAEAEREYRADLVRFPENGWALFGLAQSLERQGKLDQARGVQARFRAAWARADVTLTASRF